MRREGTVLRYFFGFRVFLIDKGEMFNQACRGCFFVFIQGFLFQVQV